MPNILKIFAQELKGKLSGNKETEFWEASSISEFEKNASEIGYEIVPTMDASTDRCFLVGFNAEESPIVGVNQFYAQLKMYFIEVTVEQFNSWVAKIKQHRLDQEQDAFLRRSK
ncbi:MAG: hypothetical protein M0R17_03140 [Candidatus Omnitrophica bacterium]|nr:hypothetical protein [Candidatus Omnitrophota bacterium]